MSFDLPRPPRGPLLAASLALVAVLCVAGLGAAGAWRVVPAPPAEAPVLAAPLAVPSTPAPAFAEPPPLRLRSRVVRVERDRTLAQALHELGLDGGQAKEIVAALEGKLDFGRVKPGDQVVLERVEGEKAVRRLSYRQGPADEWILERGDGGALAARKRPVEVTTQLARVAVEIQSSLYEALQAAGEDPSLAVLASDVLAWDMDFYQDVRRGDRMAMLVEKVYADGRFLRLGEVVAVDYQGEVAARRLYRWIDPEGREGHYDDDGASARRGFLKSPLKFAHQSSHFGDRRHPVLGFRKAHEGIDYAAPVGTPVWAVGDGTVTSAGWRGGCGKTVVIRHRNGYATQYCHLSEIQVASGERVVQKQVIGAVGQTGLATGPHLHFAVRRGSGGFMNPASLKLPREAPVPAGWRPEFDRAVASLRAQLDQSDVVMQ